MWVGGRKLVREVERERERERERECSYSAVVHLVDGPQ